MKTYKISTFWKIFPLVFILVGVLIGTVKYGIPIEFLLIIGTLICCIIAYFGGFKWKEMEQAFVKKIADTWLGVLILILIGAIVGTWIYSGAVPMLIYYGIKWINPSLIPFTAFIVTSFVAIFTVGTGAPTGVPRPVVNKIICTPAAARFVIATISLPGPLSSDKPFFVSVSP